MMVAAVWRQGGLGVRAALVVGMAQVSREAIVSIVPHQGNVFIDWDAVSSDFVLSHVLPGERQVLRGYDCIEAVYDDEDGSCALVCTSASEADPTIRYVDEEPRGEVYVDDAGNYFLLAKGQEVPVSLADRESRFDLMEAVLVCKAMGAERRIAGAIMRHGGFFDLRCRFSLHH